MFLFLFIAWQAHERNADDYPDDFPHTADETHEDAESGRESESCYGDDKTALLHAELHGQEAYEIGQQRGERHNQDGMERGEQDTVETASAVDTEEKKHEEHLHRLYDAGEILQKQCRIEGTLVLTVKGTYLTVHILQGLTMRLRETLAPAAESGQLRQIHESVGKAEMPREKR